MQDFTSLAFVQFLREITVFGSSFNFYVFLRMSEVFKLKEAVCEESGMRFP